MALRRRGLRGRRSHELFPGFTDVAEIGVGSLAVVFRAREIETNRHVALKLLNVRDASARTIESFERESIALGALSSHPNIVTLYRTFRTGDGRPVLVLELCSGAVADRLHDGAGLPVAEAVSIGIKIAGALETAHRGGILHRDVKPQNILVTDFGEPALADFGVAMLQSSTQTTAGLFDFTTLHAAPELLEGGGTSAATDVYELASSLYQLIAGKSAFRALEGESPASVILRILRDPVRPLSGADVPMGLSDLLIRAMSKQMDARPPTAAEFAAELADVEIAQAWHRTQFLIRDPMAPDAAYSPHITRMPDAVPRGLASTLAPSGPIAPLTPVPPPGAQPGYWTPRPARPAARVARVPASPLPASPLPVPPPAPPLEPPATEVVASPVDPGSWTAPTLTAAAGWTPPPGNSTVPVAPVPPPSLEPPPPRAPLDQEPAQAAEAEPPPGNSTVPVTPVPPPELTSEPTPEPESEPEPELQSEPEPEPEPEPESELQPEPEPEPPADRVRVEIDDEYFPAPRPRPARPEPAGPSPARRFEPGPDGVPVWAVRAPNPPPTGPAHLAVPQFVGDCSLDPMSLPARTTLRSGASALRVDEHRLRLRTWFRVSEIPWTDVHGFEAHLETDDAGLPSTGELVAHTVFGTVELPGTRRPAGELRYVHALLDAYHLRARQVAQP